MHRVLITSISLTGEVEPTDCDDGDIQLSGYDSASRGRVEICRGNIWGSVCYRAYDPYSEYEYEVHVNDIRTICRTLGYSNIGECSKH